MRRLGTAIISAMALCGASAALYAQSAPEATFTRVEFPADYAKTFVRYDVVDKLDRNIVRMFYVNPQALAAIKPNEPFPSGTVIVMENRAALLDARGMPIKTAEGKLQATGRIRSIEVMEKRSGWGETNLFPADKDNGDWEYASFKPEGAANPAKLDACHACHLPLKDQDFLFGAAKLRAAKP